MYGLGHDRRRRVLAGGKDHGSVASLARLFPARPSHRRGTRERATMRRVGKSLLLLAPAVLLAIEPLRLGAQVGPAVAPTTQPAATQPATPPAEPVVTGTGTPGPTSTEIRIPAAPPRPTT